MDTLFLKNFFEYKPIFNDNPQYIVDEIKKLSSDYLDESSIELIQKTYEYAREAHKSTLPRHSGEPYIVHPVLVAKFLMYIKPDLASIQAALLHDVIEDTDLKYDDIKTVFGEDVANLCQGLEKVSKVRYKGEERQLETLKKTFLAMGKDIRVIFVKLADRIHNIQTLQFHPKEEKRLRIAYETLKIFVPMAERLGLSFFQGYLENGSFKILNNSEFNRIFNYIKKNFSDSEGYTKKGIEIITQTLNKHEISNFEIRGRIKSPYRIYKKLQKYNTKDISKVMDILAFRIVTEGIDGCYSVLGFIHSEFTPIIHKIKDYIALPKANGYKSIHTTILGMFDFPVEIQIRTKEMDEYAEYGIAAHFAYKENEKSVLVPESQSIWIQSIQDLVKNFQEEPDKEKFKDILQIEIFDKNIFIYTPNGDVKELPDCSTVLDFAFRVHTDIGLRFKHAFVNGRIVPIDYKLKTGDIVKIETFKNKYTASGSWQSILYTPSAKNKLNRFVKHLERKNYISVAEKLFNDKLENFGLPLLYTKHDLISKKYKDEEMEDLLFRFYDNQVSVVKVIKEIYKNIFKDTIEHNIDEEDLKKEYIPVVNSENKKVIIDTDKALDYTLCPECNPKYPHKILSRSGKDGIKIHTMKCKAVKNISYDKLIEAHWEGTKNTVYVLKLNLDVLDKPGVLLQILSIFYDLNINLSNIQVLKGEGSWNKNIIELEFINPSKIYYVLKELKNKENLVKVLEVEII